MDGSVPKTVLEDFYIVVLIEGIKCQRNAIVYSFTCPVIQPVLDVGDGIEPW